MFDLAPIRDLAPAQQVAQLVFVPAPGRYHGRADPDPDRLHRWVGETGVGGVLVLEGDPFETGMIVNHLQRLAPVPLLTCADFEEGTGRVVPGTVWLPPNGAIGAVWASGRTEQALAFARAQGRITGAAARALGISMVLGPVLDCQTEPRNPIVDLRAFGADAASVGALGTAFIEGCAESGALSCGKHFPGHGPTALDSHLELPSLPAFSDDDAAGPLAPFTAAIRAGVGAVMTGHLLVPDRDPDLPASLSPRLTQSLLRGRMGFDGLVMTDALMMQAVAARWGPDEAAVLALEAGADVVLYPTDPEAAVRGILAAIEAGRLHPARVEESLRRVLFAKQRAGLLGRRFADLSTVPDRALETATDSAARALAEASVTLVEDPKQILPWRTLPPKLRLVEVADGTARGDALRLREGLGLPIGPPANGRAAAGPEAPSSSTADPVAALRSCGSDPVVVALLCRARGFRGRVGPEEPVVAALRAVAARSAPTVIVALGSPQALRPYPGTGAALVCAYNECPAAQAAATRAVRGEIPCSGRLPFPLSG